MKRGQSRRKGVLYAPAGGKSGRVRFPALHAFGPPRGHFRGESALPCAFAAKTVFSARTATDTPPEARKITETKIFRRMGEWAAKAFFVKAELAARAEKPRARAASQKTRTGRVGRRQKKRLASQKGGGITKKSHRKRRATSKKRLACQKRGGITKNSHRKTRATSKKRLACQKGGSGTKNRTERVGAAAKICGGAHSFLLTKPLPKTDKGFAF